MRDLDLREFPVTLDFIMWYINKKHLVSGGIVGNQGYLVFYEGSRVYNELQHFIGSIGNGVTPIGTIISIRSDVGLQKKIKLVFNDEFNSYLEIIRLL